MRPSLPSTTGEVPPQRTWWAIPQKLAGLRVHLKRVAERELAPRTHQRHDASDVVQETLLRAIRQQHQFHGANDADLTAWMEGILRHQIVDLSRYERRAVRDVRREESFLESPCSKTATGSQVISCQEQAEAIEQALASLPDDYRQVLLLRQLQELNFEEIAERMSRTPDACRMLWGRALVALGARLKSHA